MMKEEEGRYPEDTLFVIGAGIESLLEEATKVKFKTREGLGETRMDYPNLASNMYEFLVSSAVSLWHSVLVNTVSSDVVFLENSKLLLNPLKDVYLKGSCKFTVPVSVWKRL